MRVKLENGIVREVCNAILYEKRDILVLTDVRDYKIVLYPNTRINDETLLDELFNTGKLDVSYFKNIDSKGKVYVDEDYYDDLNSSDKEYIRYSF